jgi:hypothetical protein
MLIATLLMGCWEAADPVAASLIACPPCRHQRAHWKPRESLEIDWNFLDRPRSREMISHQMQGLVITVWMFQVVVCSLLLGAFFLYMLLRYLPQIILLLIVSVVVILGGFYVFWGFIIVFNWIVDTMATT